MTLYQFFFFVILPICSFNFTGITMVWFFRDRKKGWSWIKSFDKQTSLKIYKNYFDG